MPRRLEGWLRTLRLRLLGPGEIVPPQGDGLEPNGPHVAPLTIHRHTWGPCTWRTYRNQWGWWTNCACGTYARC